MAVGINTIWRVRPSATASNVNGALFNPERTGQLNDLAATASSGQNTAPTVSSVTYTFVATDINAWLFIQSGGTFLAGWYLITGVSAGVATLSAGIGAAVLYTSGAARSFALNTSAGCATTTTPTAGVFMIDYSQQNGAIIAAVTDYTAVGSSTTLTSVTGGFTKAMTGNGYHQTTTGTGAFGLQAWFEITSVTDGNTLTLDRTPNNGTASVGCTGYIGGAASLNTTSGAAQDDTFFENGLGTNGSGAHIFAILTGSYLTMGTISISASGGTQAPVRIIGYSTYITDGMAGDLGTSRPTLGFVANTITTGQQWDVYNVIMTGTAANATSMNNNSKWVWVKAVNSSTTAARTAFVGGTDFYQFGCEGISYRGIAFNVGNLNGQLVGGYYHDSDTAYLDSGTGNNVSITNCIFADNITYGIRLSAASTASKSFIGNTFSGVTAQTGTGISMVTGVTDVKIVNNIITGFTTGIAHADAQTTTFVAYNDFSNNGSDVSSVAKDILNIALSPSFTNVTQVVTAGTPTSSGAVLTDSSANFASVVDNQDFLVFTAGSGTGYVGSNIKLQITSHTSTTVTLSSNITSSGSISGAAYRIGVGHNFAVGTNLAATGYPGSFPGALTTGYLDIGAAQRQASGGSGMLFIPNLEGT